MQQSHPHKTVQSRYKNTPPPTGVCLPPSSPKEMRRKDQGGKGEGEGRKEGCLSIICEIFAQLRRYLTEGDISQVRQTSQGVPSRIAACILYQ